MRTIRLCLPLSLSLLPLLLGGGNAGATGEKVVGGKFCTCYSDFYGEGSNYTFEKTASDLGNYGLDKAISSVSGTGFWVFFENVYFNGDIPGDVHWVHGIDFEENFPSDFSDKSSSLRVVGSPAALNADYWAIFEGPSFTGWSHSGDDNVYSLDYTGPISSILVIGLNPWTFYTERDYLGESICLYPNSSHHTGSGGQSLDLGIYHHTPEILNKTVQSLRSQCYSEHVLYGYEEVYVEGMAGHGSSSRA